MSESQFKSAFKRKLLELARQKRKDLVIIEVYDQRSMPDVIVLCGEKWAALEFKRSSQAAHRPNQDYFVDKLDQMSFATFVHPQNEEEVINELEFFFFE